MKRIDYDTAVRDQPANLERARRSIVEALADATIEPWRAGDTVAVVAMGASSHAAHALVFALAASGMRAVALTASDASFYPAGAQSADHYVIISESGRSPEPITAARGFTPGRRIGITNVPDSPLTAVVDVAITFGDLDDSGVYTVGYTSTLLAAALLCEHMLGMPVGDAEGIPTRVAATLAQFAAAAELASERLATAQTVDFVGRGMSLAAASEGALMFREALAVPTAAFDTYQYLHGPMEPLREHSGLVVFGDDRELSLVDSVLDSGVQVCLVTQRPLAELARPAHENLVAIALPADATGFERAILEVLVPQLIVGYSAARSGRRPGEFTYRQPDTKLPLT
ncbi:SIS domain-containing protein [Microbacterium sp. MPKO10]|uniref:SIS domain-containing protein n=1 Tax=Microbacterium sp. MPKO10 TaxID=2989818 RepID=UPI002236B370|nr:SIS domain-containing protein [Microbacterium sp. MPKO10]MCW4457610.1 SIS domain-containing protein [Microbacterium sp. MPKO10]